MYAFRSMKSQFNENPDPKDQEVWKVTYSAVWFITVRGSQVKLLQIALVFMGFYCSTLSIQFEHNC